MAKMYTLGCTFKPSANHAGGLRYHGMSPILSKLYADKYMEAESYEQTKVFEAAVQFAKLETILPAPESAHAIRGAIDEALKCKETGETKTKSCSRPSMRCRLSRGSRSKLISTLLMQRTDSQIQH